MRRPARARASGGTAVVVGALLASACGAGDDPGAGAADNPEARAVAAESAGTLVMGDGAYAFVVRTCDPEGRDPNGVTLRGHGTAPDGRRLTIEVERLPANEPHGRLEHNAFVLIGGVMEGEAWSAKRIRAADGEWREAEHVDAPATGPLVEVDGRRVSVRGTLWREGSEDRVEAELLADCPG